MRRAQSRRWLLALSLTSVAAACAGERGESPFLDIGPVTEVVVHNWDPAFTRDTIRELPRVDSITAFIRAGTDWSSEPPRAVRDSMFAITLMRDGRPQAGVLIGPNFITDSRRTPERDFARHRVLSSDEATRLRRLLGRQ
jgi:hypothetical protein